ncbi:MAG TPA: hypothetical protein VHS76_09335 [Steroidobacteraceae bacterium]|jgi:hypothetical protein|nr:hypothetical protein [Steroidobacteraceae bacterium]
MEVSDLKPFNPNDIDETLTRVVVHAGKTHLLFPFVNAVGHEPKYDSIGMVIAGPAATIQDFQKLTLMIETAGKSAVWRIVFSTPWLTRISDAEERPPRTRRS